jgi:hypothetical protein
MRERAAPQRPTSRHESLPHNSRRDGRLVRPLPRSSPSLTTLSFRAIRSRVSGEDARRNLLFALTPLVILRAHAFHRGPKDLARISTAPAAKKPPSPEGAEEYSPRRKPWVTSPFPHAPHGRPSIGADNNSPRDGRLVRPLPRSSPTLTTLSFRMSVGGEDARRNLLFALTPLVILRARAFDRGPKDLARISTAPAPKNSQPRRGKRFQPTAQAMGHEANLPHAPHLRPSIGADNNSRRHGRLGPSTPSQLSHPNHLVIPTHPTPRQRRGCA